MKFQKDDIVQFNKLANKHLLNKKAIILKVTEYRCFIKLLDGPEEDKLFWSPIPCLLDLVSRPAKESHLPDWF